MSQKPFVAGAPSAQLIDTAAAILGRAFVSDPLFIATLRDPLRRDASLPLTFRALVREFAPGGALDVVERDGRPVGAALWADGRRNEITLRSVLGHGQLRFGLAAGVRDSLRLMRVQNQVTATHHELITEPHLYLLGIGVEPGCQGKGVGTELLERGLAWTDERALPAYLETNLEQNARLYARKGFVTVRKTAPAGFETWHMIRPVGG